jgi:very-short-patch-repair endonuclease
MDASSAIRRLGGAARWSQLRDAGVTRATLVRDLHLGVVERPWRGCYVLPGTPTDKVLATVFRAEVTCVTALAAWGLPIVTPDARTHLLVPRDRGLSPDDRRDSAKVRLHRADHRLANAPVLDAAVAIGMATSCLSPRDLVAVVDGALRRGLVVAEQLRDLPTRASTAWLATATDGRAESLLESLARLEIVAVGLPVRSQVEIDGVGRVDLMVEDVVIETDGWEHHATRGGFVRDRRRDRELQKRGYRIARFAYSDVVEHPGTVASEVLALLGR